MDRSEQLAKQYLQNLGFEDVRFEPDGNVPPDFLLNNRIAVEVRQLNQNHVTNFGYRGLDEDAIPLFMKFRKLLTSLGPSSGESWFVRFQFSRPIQPWSEIQNALRDCLSEFRNKSHPQQRVDVMIDDNFELNLIRASYAHEMFFVFGGYGDYDSGGWVFGETQKNLRICVEEKSRKVAGVRHKYQEWWLILIDYIGYGVEQCDEKLYREQLKIQHNWDKIVLLDPLNATRGFEL